MVSYLKCSPAVARAYPLWGIPTFLVSQDNQKNNPRCALTKYTAQAPCALLARGPEPGTMIIRTFPLSKYIPCITCCAQPVHQNPNRPKRQSQ